MLELSLLRENKDLVVEGLKKRNWSAEELAILDQIITLDDLRKKLQTDLDALLAERNKLSKEIGDLFKQGKQADASAAKDKVASIKDEVTSIESAHKKAEEDLTDLLLKVPNVPHSSVPAGEDEKSNEVHKPWPNPFPKLGEEAIPHWELASNFNLFDLELGTKITGPGFPVFRGKGARLERGMINFFLDRAIEAGYEEIMPPILVNGDTAMATGQLPDKEAQMYHTEKDQLYLIPTAEVPVTNIYRNVILNEDDFPIKLTAYTPCFRREAGSYGADVRGLNRVHQFDKVEIVRIEHPEKSYDALEEMVSHVEALLVSLDLPYRILKLCGGDMGFTSALTYDFEVYSAAQKRWLEVSSVSNFETYQTNRLKLRYRDGKHTRLAHTLNGSALALARIVAAILENNQTVEGILIPEILRPYVGFSKIE
ncbi:MAG: serine--tRNA ligase [Saprospiraceae bacterium]|jgi:seryl-tRNA synthetase